MNAIKAKETVINGFKYLVYKTGRKEVCRISFPNKYSESYKCIINKYGICFGQYANVDEAKYETARYLDNYYSVFGGCSIKYL